MLPSRLVFCGGGTRCLAFVQTLVLLEKAGHLRNVNECWGTSAGALLATLMRLGSAEDVKKAMWSADFVKFRNIEVTNMLNIQSTWGLDDGTSLRSELERLLESIRPGSGSYVLRDVSGVNIVVADLSVHQTIVLNREKYPDLKLVDAIRASMSLPLLFRPFVCPLDGHLFVDGAVRAHFPWYVLPDDVARRSALGFTFEKAWIGGPKTFVDYLFSMIHFDEPKKNADLKAHWPRNILWYPTPPFPAWFVRFREEDYSLVEQMGASVYEAFCAASAASAASATTSNELMHEGGSECPPGTSGNPTPCAPRCTPSPSCPPHCTTESSGSPPACQAPFQDSSQPQSLHKRSDSRRWSF